VNKIIFAPRRVPIAAICCRVGAADGSNREPMRKGMAGLRSGAASLVGRLTESVSRGATFVMWIMLAAFMAWPAGAAPGDGPATDAGPADGPAIYVARRGWHADVGFAAAQLQAPLDTLAADFPGLKYLFMGFGDRRYLLAKHRSAPATIAALWPGAGLILATGLRASPDAAFGGRNVLKLEVSRAQLLAAQAFVWQSLGDSHDPNRAPVRLPVDGPYDGSLYFKARDRYSALHTCNTWAAEVLRHAGLPMTSSGVVFAGQVWRRAKRLAAE
jgi:hypothetical protein